MRKAKKPAEEPKLRVAKGGKENSGDNSKKASSKSGPSAHSGHEKFEVNETAASYSPSRTTESSPTIFKVSRGGKQKKYSISQGYGYFVPLFHNASNLKEINELLERGILFKDIESIIDYLQFKVPEIAKAASVSPSTVSRWTADSSIGVPGSNQFFKIDEMIKKGVDLFGGLEELKGWLNTSNIALGNEIPSKLITSQIGVALVDEALDALHFGNVM